MPGFLGGSDLAVPVGAQQGARRRLDQGLHEHVGRDGAPGGAATSRTRLACSARASNERAALRSWFVPTAKNWVNVENGNILRNMLAQILTGKLTVKQAAQSASDNITSVLNALGRANGARIAVTVPGPRRAGGRREPRRVAASGGGAVRSCGAVARGSVRPPDPAGRGRDRRDPRLPALQARHALVPAVRPLRADPAQGRVDRPRQLPLGPPRPASSGTRSCGRSSSRS